MNAKKFISNEIKNGIEIIKHKVIEININQEELKCLCNDLKVYDDPETSYISIGVIIGFDDDIHNIHIGKFLDYIDDIDEELQPTGYDDLLKELSKYREYTLYF